MITDEERSYHLANYAAFLRLSNEEKLNHNGEYALFSDGRLIDYFQTNREAIKAAYDRRLQGKYSVQVVTPQPEDIGFFDCANYPR